jgi:hypothetical protein
MKRATLIAALLVGASAAHAEPYAALSLMRLTPEVSAGYATKWLDVEVGVLAEHQIDTLIQISTVEEWTVRGNRLTAKLHAPLAASLDVVAGLSAYDAEYKYKQTGVPTTSTKKGTWGASLGLTYHFNKRVSGHIEQVFIDTPDGVFGPVNPVAAGFGFKVGDVRATRLGLAVRF